MAAAASMSSGCLIEDPPPYTQPEQTPPRLDLVATSPQPEQILVRKTGDVVNFTIPVVSEDAGDRLQGSMLLDVGMPVEFGIVSQGFAPASTLDDLERELSLSWEIRPFVPSGCHRLTLRVSHQLNFLNDAEVLDPKDLAEAYWWVILNPETSGATLENCALAVSGGQ